jgi:hypothetical protein
LPPEHLRGVKRVGPAVAEEFLDMQVVFLDHIGVKVRNLVRKFRTGEVEDEGAIDDRHFDREQLFIGEDELRNVVIGD